MKETIYTIPINDAFDKQDGSCPLCNLAAKLEADAVDYVMGAAMMEPDVRIETNRLGFCGSHFDQMLAKGSRLPLALILESHLMEHRKSLPKAKGNPADTCFVCHRVSEYMQAYLRNFYYMYDVDATFHAKLINAKLCYPHIGTLLAGAPAHLKRKPAEALRADLQQMADKRFAEITPLVTTFCRSFDHRFADEPLGEARTAVEQAISWLTGVAHGS